MYYNKLQSAKKQHYNIEYIIKNKKNILKFSHRKVTKHIFIMSSRIYVYLNSK
jgi:hypothetical protein